MTAPATTALSVPLSTETKQRLDRLASEAATSPAELVAEAVRSYLEVQEWQVEEIRAGVREADAGVFASDQEVRSVISKWSGAG
jgi:predicted transcriptional regulator